MSSDSHIACHNYTRAIVLVANIRIYIALYTCLVVMDENRKRGSPRGEQNEAAHITRSTRGQRTTPSAIPKG